MDDVNAGPAAGADPDEKADTAIYVEVRNERVKLTRQQEEVLRLVVAGKENAVIAQLLGATAKRKSIAGVVNKLSHLLGVETRVDLASRGREVLGLSAAGELRQAGEVAKAAIRRGTAEAMQTALKTVAHLADDAAARGAE
jgi:DNA-binding CsgD family transcriptional regulator